MLVFQSHTMQIWSRWLRKKCINYSKAKLACVYHTFSQDSFTIVATHTHKKGITNTVIYPVVMVVYYWYYWFNSLSHFPNVIGILNIFNMNPKSNLWSADTSEDNTCLWNEKYMKLCWRTKQTRGNFNPYHLNEGLAVEV